MVNQIKQAAEFILSQTSENPVLGLILGSGLGVLAEQIEDATIISYKDIPHFPVSTVEGHAGQLVIGKLGGKIVAAMQGRFHFYEGYSMQEVTFPVRVMNEMGITHLLVTNAAGGVNKDFKAGDLMIIEDHINFTGTSPLIGPNFSEFGPRFPDMSKAYDTDLRLLANSIAKELDIDVKQGVYIGFSGPTYETPAEVRMARILGSDAVGMSTVPEVIVAVHGGMKVLGISCITNMAAGILDQPLSHQEVIETTEKVKSTFLRFVKDIVAQIDIEVAGE